MAAAAQHYLECDECENHCEFYCLICHKKLCHHCQNEHRKNPNTQSHDVVLYQHRHKTATEKCPLHPANNVDIMCTDCQIPLSSKCSMGPDHQGHHFVSLEEIHAENFEKYQKKLYAIHEYFLPVSKEVLHDIKEDVTKVKERIDVIRVAMMSQADAVKRFVDTVVSESMTQLDEIEGTILQELNTQDKTLVDYMSYLHELEVSFQSKIPKKDCTGFTFKDGEENFQGISPIPEILIPVLPEYEQASVSKQEIKKLLGKVKSHATVEKRKARVPIKNSGPQAVQDPEECIETQTGRMNEENSSYSVTKVKDIMVPGISETYHISLDKFGRLWVSDNLGHLVQTDFHGNPIRKIKVSNTGAVCHTVTLTGDVLYTDKLWKNAINRLTPDTRVIQFISTENWEPLSVYSSRINGHILVGMCKSRDARVTRYSIKGKVIQNIKMKNVIHSLYEFPKYLAENGNGDICASDIGKQAVVVVNKFGKHRFTYTGHPPRSGFHPYGICTDVFGHILVYDAKSYSVHLLDQAGHFLSLLITRQHGVADLRGLCVDEENNLFVGEGASNFVKLYKYF